MKEWLEKNKNNFKYISYCLLIVFLGIVIYTNLRSLIMNLNSFHEISYLLYSFVNTIIYIIVGCALEIGFFIYFFQIVTKKVKDTSKSNFMLVCFGLIPVVNNILGIFSNLSNPNSVLLFSLLLIGRVGILQYFVTINQIKNSKTIAMSSCAVMILYYGYSCLKYFSLDSLMLILIFLSLIPYIYFLELKNEDKVKFDKNELQINKSQKTKISILAIIYFIIGLIITKSGIHTIYTIFSILIFIYTWINAKKMTIFIVGLNILMEISCIILANDYSSDFQGIYYFATIILIAMIIMLVTETVSNTTKENVKNIKNDNETEETEEDIENKKYKELLDMGIIDKAEYDKVTLK